MKIILNSVVFFVLIVFTFSTACVPNKKLRASQNRVAQLTQDSVDTHRKLDEKAALLEEKNKEVFAVSNVLPEEKKELVVSKALPEEKKARAAAITPHVELVAPFPPAIVASVFNINYPTIKDVLWTKETTTVKPEKAKDYKANFSIEHDHYSVVYSQDGELMETRVKILPAQLPQGIHTAIKNKYADAYVVSAETFKHSKREGSYAVMIGSKSFLKDIELILMENGEIVK
jgi:hypothetical protein